MVCVLCGQKTKVINSRLQRKANQVWRRRQCLSCKTVFSTQETVQHELAWLVGDKGRFEPFSRDKLFLSLYKSCEHRKTALSDAKGLTDTVISKLPAHLSGSMLKPGDIAAVAQVALNRFDKAASVHYQAFYKS
jgi:transcriptional repressor NrdR